VTGWSSWLSSIGINSRKQHLGVGRYRTSSDSGHIFSPIGLSVEA